MREDRLPISVIIVNYKTSDLTVRALSALFCSSRLPSQVILVDNHSEDGVIDRVKKLFPEVQIMESAENLGFAKANNWALTHAVTQPFVWLLNSDTETGEKSLEELYTQMSRHEDLGAIGPQLVYPNGELQSVGGFSPSIINVFTYLVPISFFLPKKIRQRMRSIALFPQRIPQDGIILDYVTGAACLLRKKALDEVGLLAEDYFMYFEETDLCFRLKKAGWMIKAIDTEPVMHVYGGSFKTKYDARRLTLFLESLKIFVKKNIKGFQKFIILLEIGMLGRISVLLKRLRLYI